jgi:hypothetical protein
MDESSRPAVAVAASGVSAVSWAAILAGAAVAVASSLILFALATGLDLVAVSRSTGSGQVAVVAIGLVVTQWVSACLGGYVTGRLRTRWINTHTHEVFFRDTVHGFITWCVATIVVASGIAAASGTHQRFFGRTSFEPSQTLLVQPSSAQGSQIVTEQVSQVAGELVIPPGHESAQAGDAGFTEVRARLRRPVRSGTPSHPSTTWLPRCVPLTSSRSKKMRAYGGMQRQPRYLLHSPC